MADSNPDLVVRIAANISALQTDMAAAAATIKTIEDATTNASHATDGWTSVLTDLGSNFVARVAEGELLATAIEKIAEGAKEVIMAFPELLAHTVEVGNSLFEMSVKTGSSVEGLSALRYVASQTGVDFSSFGTALTMMEKNLGATGEAGVKVGLTLASMGLDLATMKNQRSDEAFIDIAHALFEVSNNADKAHDAAVLMGKGAKEMAGLWHEDIGPMIEEAKDLGLIMSTETAAGAHLAEIGFQGLKMQLEAVGMQIANAFLPAIIGIEDDLSHGLHEAVAAVNGSLDTLGGSNGGFLGTVARAMGTGDEATKAQIALYGDLKDGVIGLIRYGLEPIITTVGFVMTEFNAAKVVWQDVIQIIDGVKLAYLGVQQAMSLGLLPGTADLVKWKELDDQIAHLEVTMQVRGDAMQKDKANQTDWAAWSVDTNKAVEIALTAVGAAHTDVGKKIKEMGDVSRTAYGGMSDAADAMSAATVKANESAASKIAELWGEYAQFSAKAEGDLLAAKLAAIDAWYDKQYAEIEKSKADETAKAAWINALDSALYAKREAAAEENGAKLKKIAADQAAELQKVTDEYYKAVNATSHNSLAAQVDDVYLAAQTKVTTLQNSTKYSVEAEMKIWETADVVAAHLVQKNLESDANTKSHFQLLADTARDAYEFAMGHLDEYSQKEIDALRSSMEKAATIARDGTDSITQDGIDAMNKLLAEEKRVADLAAGVVADAVKKAADAQKQIYGMPGAGKDAGLGMGTDSYGNKYYLQPGQSTYANQGTANTGAGLGQVTFRAEGGPVSAGSPYMVGERGPELFVPSSNGSISSNGGGASIVNHIYVNGTATDVARQVAAEIMRTVKQGARL